MRLMIYDRTCRGRGLTPGLSTAWSAGGVLYRAAGRLDAWSGVASWSEGLDWLLERSAGRPISEIQFWGHGTWGRALIANDILDIAALQPGHALHERLLALKARLVDDGSAAWWFRTCETFGTRVGKDFARAWTRFFGCRAAGHTYVIGALQSGLHVLAPGEEPSWPDDEAVVPGSPHAKSSSVLAPRTITCFHGALPRS